MAIDSEWEKFQGGPTEGTTVRLHATVNNKSLILLNANLHRLLGKPLAVNLFFNRQRAQIALQATSPRLHNAFPLRENKGCYVICAAPFFKHYGIKINETHRFIRPELMDDGRLILKLNETVVVTRRRSKAA